MICQRKNCENPAKLIGNFCIAHTCSDETCINEPAQGDEYCENHVCEWRSYEVDDSICTRKKEGMYFCGEYKCRVKNCEGTTTPQRLYCVLHKCVYVGCKNLRNQDSAECSGHLCRFDEVQCMEKAMYVDNSGTKHDTDYCLRHRCTKLTCQQKIVDISGRCITHKCPHAGCLNSSFGVRGPACITHLCGVENSLVTRCEELKMLGYIACKKHICNVADCNELVYQKYYAESGTYCKEHMCTAIYCVKMRFKEYDLCSRHAGYNAHSFTAFRLSDYGKIMIKDINVIIKKYIN